MLRYGSIAERHVTCRFGRCAVEYWYVGSVPTVLYMRWNYVGFPKIRVSFTRGFCSSSSTAPQYGGLEFTICDRLTVRRALSHSTSQFLWHFPLIMLRLHPTRGSPNNNNNNTDNACLVAMPGRIYSSQHLWYAIGVRNIIGTREAFRQEAGSVV